jgi:hypothetical protein
MIDLVEFFWIVEAIILVNMPRLELVWPNDLPE